MNSHYNKLEIISKFNFRDLVIFFIPVFIFSVYLSVYNPGVLTYDSFNQLHQIASGQFYNWHPFFHTFIEMICLKIYPNPVSVGILQIFIFSIMWMIICKYNRNDDVEGKNQFILQFIITLVISLIPINAIYSITLWKDILFSYFLMFSCFLISVIVDKNGQSSYKFILVFSIVLAFVSQLRPNGIYIIAFLLIILTTYFFRKDRNNKIFIILPALTILFILLIASLNVVYDVEDNQKDAVLAKTAHMLVDYDLNLDIDEIDREKIHKLINNKDLKKDYTPYYSDPVYWVVNPDVFDDNKAAYIEIAIKYSLQNPLHFLKYMLKSSAMVWDITRDNDWAGQPYYIDENGTNLQNTRNRFFNSHKVTPISDFEKINEVNLGTDEYDFFNFIVNQVKVNIVLNNYSLVRHCICT